MAGRADSADDEESLVDRFRRGDAEALEVLLDGCRTDLEGAARRGLPARLRRRVSVSDVLQETRFAAYEGREGFRYGGEGSFRRWVLGIARNKILMTLRHHLGTGKRDAALEAAGPGSPTVSGLPSPGPSPSQVAVGAELEALAGQALESLSAEERSILRLTREEGLSVAAAGESLNLPPGIAKKVYGRALVRFRGAFLRLQDGGDA